MVFLILHSNFMDCHLEITLFDYIPTFKIDEVRRLEKSSHFPQSAETSREN